jgi:ATP-dependent RNA helicase RhlE
MTKTFKELDLIPELEQALTKQNYSIPTPIQSKSIPALLQGKDLIGIAQTGTGKTAAFVLPILQRMTEKYPRKIKTLVLTPTRELAAQIGESFSTYGEFLKFKHTVIFGGVKQGRQVQALSQGVDILVATPGRLLDLMNQRKLTLENIDFFVLDEADRMLDMGFIHDIKKIIARLPHHRQSLFFSATMSPTVNTLARSLLKNPVHVEVAPQATTVERIKQYIFFVDPSSKLDLLLKLLEHEHLTSVLVFTRTKHKANKVASFLSRNKISADAIHGNKSQSARTKAIKDFKTGRTKVLVATDIAARGIDIDNISHVINFELPNESESYVHRIGRTARAGAEGTAFSFCSAEERNYLHSIEKLIKQRIEVMDHEFHSESAKNAKGAAAKPPPKGRYSRGSRGSSSGNRWSRGSGSRSSSRSNDSKPSGNRRSFSRNSNKGNRHKRSFRR